MLPSFLAPAHVAPSFARSNNSAPGQHHPGSVNPQYIATASPSTQYQAQAKLPVKPAPSVGVSAPKVMARPSFLSKKEEPTSAETTDTAVTSSEVPSPQPIRAAESAAQPTSPSAQIISCDNTSHSDSQTAVAPTNKVCLAAAGPILVDQTATNTTTEERHILAERFKTKMCRNFITQGFCPYESRCMFAHGDAEMRTAEMNIRDGLFTEEAIKAFKRGEVPQPHMVPTVIVGGNSVGAPPLGYNPQPRFQQTSQQQQIHQGVPLMDRSAVSNYIDPNLRPSQMMMLSSPQDRFQPSHSSLNQEHQHHSVDAIPIVVTPGGYRSSYESVINSNPFVNQVPPSSHHQGFPNMNHAHHISGQFGGGRPASSTVHHQQQAVYGSTRSVEEGGYQSVTHSYRPYTPNDDLFETDEEAALVASTSAAVGIGSSRQLPSSSGRPASGHLATQGGSVAALQALLARSSQFHHQRDHSGGGAAANNNNMSSMKAAASGSTAPLVGVVGDGTTSSREGSGRAAFTFNNYTVNAPPVNAEPTTPKGDVGTEGIPSAFLQSLHQLQQMSDYYQRQNGIDSSPDSDQRSAAMRTTGSGRAEAREVTAIPTATPPHMAFYSGQTLIPYNTSLNALDGSNAALYDSSSVVGSSRPEVIDALPAGSGGQYYPANNAYYPSGYGHHQGHQQGHRATMHSGGSPTSMQQLHQSGLGTDRKPTFEVVNDAYRSAQPQATEASKGWTVTS